MIFSFGWFAWVGNYYYMKRGGTTYFLLVVTNNPSLALDTLLLYLPVSSSTSLILFTKSFIRGVTIKYPDNCHKILQNCSISLYLSSFESINFYKFIASEKIGISYLVSELRDFLVTRVNFPRTYFQFSEIFTENLWKWFNFDPLGFVFKAKCLTHLLVFEKLRYLD